MMLAELHGKVPASVSESEDVLTSYVFGTLEALPSERLLVPWLRRAIRLDGSPLALPREVQACFQLWPTVTAQALGRQVEPDAIITLQESPIGATVALVEAKFRSGPSGWPTGPETPKVTGQLGQEWLALGELSSREMPKSPAHIGRRILLYITADLVLPSEVIAEMSLEVAKAGGDPELFRQDVYWLSWRDLSVVIEQQGLNDITVCRLREILDRRRLSVFAGCPAPADSLALGWNYMGHHAYAFSCPEHKLLPWIYREGATYAMGRPTAVTPEWSYPRGGK